MTVKGGQVKSIKSLKASLKKGGGGDSFIKYVPTGDDGLTVRFLSEPDEWFEYDEHFDEAAKKSTPCQGADICPYCDNGDRKTHRYLANVVDKDDMKAVPLQMPKTLAKQILNAYEKYGTLLDRDYGLTKEGTGMDTKYFALPERESKMNLSRFTPLDLTKVLNSQLIDMDDADDEDDEEDDVPVRRPRKAVKTVSAKKRRVVEDDDDDDDEPPPRRMAPRKVAPKKALRKAPPVVKTLRKRV